MQLNNNYWTAHYTGLSGNSIHDKVTGATLDGTLKIDDAGALTSCASASAQTWRHKTREDYDNDWTGGSSQYDFYTTPDRRQPDHLRLARRQCDLDHARFPNYMQGAGGSFPTHGRRVQHPEPAQRAAER